MSNLKCKSCGLVNPHNTTDCKRCGASLIVADDPKSPPSEMQDQKQPEPVTVWGCIQTLIVLTIAGPITGYLGYCFWGWFPSGYYSVLLLILIFIPPAIVGLAAGLGVLWFINLFIPGELTKGSASGTASAD